MRNDTNRTERRERVRKTVRLICFWLKQTLRGAESALYVFFITPICARSGRLGLEAWIANKNTARCAMIAQLFQSFLNEKLTDALLLPVR